MTDQPFDDLSRRVQRIEDLLEIQQLAVRYAMAVDERDVDAWVNLFVPDVEAGKGGVGRPALRDFITAQLRLFYRSIHQIVGHRIDPLSSDRASGSVYCRAEHEVGKRWIVVALRYDDDYRKVGGAWYFARRTDKHWYEADVNDWPQHVSFHGWPDAPRRPLLPEPSDCWSAFWHGADTSAITSVPLSDDGTCLDL
ncbi:nuclear transport factor 2 family protein [Mycobacterium sp.]|uniref:nuclear transport factor 2 family protein n=1 Tax=Mycobacterium sp. TaxID=1785 RepID=UPI003D10FB56